MGGAGKELHSCLPPTHQGQPQPCRGAQGHSHPPHATCCRLGAAYRAAPRCAEGNKLGGEGGGNKSCPPIHGMNLLCRWRGSQHTGGEGGG